METKEQAPQEGYAELTLDLPFKKAFSINPWRSARLFETGLFSPFAMPMSSRKSPSSSAENYLSVCLLSPNLLISQQRNNRSIGQL